MSDQNNNIEKNQVNETNSDSAKSAFDEKLSEAKAFFKTTKGKIAAVAGILLFVVVMSAKIYNLTNHSQNFANGVTKSTTSSANVKKLVAMLNKQGKQQNHLPQVKKEGVFFEKAGIGDTEKSVYMKYKLSGKAFAGLSAQDIRNNGLTEEHATKQMCSNPATQKMLKHLDYIEVIYVTKSDDVIADAKISKCK